ncbi:Crp/Fnr family transcriptional regulator [Reichenbachiella versicolor]|uniref:Crp/Fnr family transcriptional regulator n=1 Tax=Reichenbachiella versicolor TaxID=1821036 RepID=UPI000D6EABB1|nr:Crp/Fnr family transcriptional regulator [Reichenbachiella versicolor]
MELKERVKKELLKHNPSFSNEEIQFGLSLFEEMDFSANSLISKAGKICDYLFFAESSITRCFYIDTDGQEQTLWMKPEQTFITEYKSFVNRDKSQFSLQFYEQTKVLMISRENLIKLYTESLSWSVFGTSLTEQVHITLIDVFVNLLANDATRNYQYIEYMFPRFIQVAPLKDIASMLQISQVSLSRIRGGKQLKK